MNISGIIGSNLPTQSLTSGIARQDDRKGLSLISAEPTAAAGKNSDGSTVKSAEKDNFDLLTDYMNQTPEQQMLTSWLMTHGMTKEEFDSLSLEEKQKVMDEIKQAIKEQFKGNAEFKARPAIDILA